MSGIDFDRVHGIDEAILDGLDDSAIVWTNTSINDGNLVSR